MSTHTIHMQPPSPNHEQTTMIDYIQASIATYSETQKQSISLLMKWWLQSSHHFTPENTQ